MFVKPAPGVLLRDPVTKHLLSDSPVKGVNTLVVPEEGMKVSDFDRYWLRRIRDKDAVKVGPAPLPSPSNTTKASASQALSAPAASAEPGVK
jgi:hypothetical protein